MAVDMYLEFPGSAIKGETVDSQYSSKNALDILAWSWGLSNSTSVHVGGGAGVGKANFQDLSFTHWFDKASPDLMINTAKGNHVDQAILHVRKAGGTQADYITITMDEVYFTSVTTGGSGGEDKLTENASLSFAKVKLEYFIQDKKGNMSAGGTFKYNIAGNTDA